MPRRIPLSVPEPPLLSTFPDVDLGLGAQP